MPDTTTARRVGRYSHLSTGWVRLPNRPDQARATAQRALDSYALDPVTGLWPSGRGPSASWLLLDEAPDDAGEVAA